MQLNGRTARTLWRQCAPLVDQILSGSASAARLKSQQITTAAHDLTRSMLQARKVLSNLQDCQSPLLKSCLPAERPAVPSSSHVSSFSTSATPSGDGSEGSSPSPAGEAGQSEAAEPVQGGPQTAEGAGRLEPGAAPGGGREEAEAGRDDLIAMLAERDVLLQERQGEVERTKESLLRALAEMENLRARTLREGEAAKKFAIQGFAKALLDVADNLTRASDAVPASYRTAAAAAPVPGGGIGNGNGHSQEQGEGASKLLRSLLEGVLLTEKQLHQVFRSHGLQVYDPTGQEFDPNEHMALFEVDDASKKDGTVGAVMKTGYKLHERVIRPAEVGVVKHRSSASS